jgi:hypothetical protein
MSELRRQSSAEARELRHLCINKILVLQNRNTATQLDGVRFVFRAIFPFGRGFFFLSPHFFAERRVFVKYFCRT